MWTIQLFQRVDIPVELVIENNDKTGLVGWHRKINNKKLITCDGIYKSIVACKFTKKCTDLYPTRVFDNTNE